MKILDFNKLTTGKNLTGLEENILEYVIENINEIQNMGVRDVAKATYTSPASVIRLSKKLGYTGFTDMYYSLLPMIKKSGHDVNSSKNTILNYNFSTIADELSEDKIAIFNEKIFKNQKDMYSYMQLVFRKLFQNIFIKNC